MRSVEIEMFFPEIEVRLRAIDAVRMRAEAREAKDGRLESVAIEIQELSERLPRHGGGPAFAAWGELLSAIGHLWNWREGVRSAEREADRHLRAAQQRARDVLAGAGAGPATEAVNRLAQDILAITSPATVPSATDSLLSIRLPLPIPDSNQRSSSRRVVSGTPPPKQPDPAVAFLEFSIGGEALQEPHDLRANVLYDLKAQVRLSRWPKGTNGLELVPLSVEPEGVVDAPAMSITREGSELVYSQTGRLRARTAHDSLARPLEISYDILPIREAEETHDLAPFVVHGQRRLLLRCEEQLYRWRGNRAVEESIEEIRLEGRRQSLPDEELATLLNLTGAVGLVASDNLANNLFRGRWLEKEFQDAIRTRLRAEPSIGSELEEHAHAGGGITDLSLHRVRLELKVDASPLTIDESVAAYGEQLAQYAVGSDRRSGVLCVLCPTKDGRAPGSLHNDIGARALSPPTGGGRSVLLAVVLVRGDLPTPSSLGR